jgi:hypothetical protein
MKIATDFAPFKWEGFDYTACADTKPSWPFGINDSISKKTEVFRKLANLG